MASSEALSTAKSRLAVCAAFVSVLLDHKRNELLLSHGGPVPQFRPPLFPTFPVYFIFLLYSPSSSFSHLPTQSSHITADCSSFRLPFLSTLPTGCSSYMLLLTPTITPSTTSAYCIILQCTVRRLSLPAPFLFSSHHHPVLKSSLRSPSSEFFPRK